MGQEGAGGMGLVRVRRAWAKKVWRAWALGIRLDQIDLLCPHLLCPHLLC